MGHQDGWSCLEKEPWSIDTFPHGGLSYDTWLVKESTNYLGEPLILIDNRVNL